MGLKSEEKSEEGEARAAVGRQHTCRLEHVVGRHLADSLGGVGRVVDAAVVEEALAHGHCHVLAVVAADKQLSAILGLYLVERAGGNRVAGQAVEFAADDAQAFADVGLVAADIYRHEAGVGEGGDETVDRIYEAPLLAELAVEDAAHAGSAQMVVEQIECIAARIVTAHGARAVDGVGLEAVVVDHGVERRHVPGRKPLGTAVGEIEDAEMLLHALYDAVGVDGRRDVDHHVAGRVVEVEKLAAFPAGERTHALGRAEDVVGKGVAGKNALLILIVDILGGGIEIRLYLLHHHFMLDGYLMLGEEGVGDDVGQELEGAVFIAGGGGGVDDGVFLRGAGVEVAADALHARGDGCRRSAPCAFEKGMLHEVGKPIMLRRLVAAS